MQWKTRIRYKDRALLPGAKAFWGLVVIIDNLFVLDPKDVDAEFLKHPSTLPMEEDDNAGDGGGVPMFPKQRYASIVCFQAKFVYTVYFRRMLVSGRYDKIV